MGMKPKFDEEKAKELIAMFKEGKKVKEIAESVKTSKATVVNYLKKAGVYKSRRKKRGKKVSSVSQASILSLEAINDKFMAAKAELKRLEKLLKKTVKREETKFKKIKKKIGV